MGRISCRELEVGWRDSNVVFTRLDVEHPMKRDLVEIRIFRLGAYWVGGMRKLVGWMEWSS